MEVKKHLSKLGFRGRESTIESPTPSCGCPTVELSAIKKIVVMLILLLGFLAGFRLALHFVERDLKSLQVFDGGN